MSNKKYWGCWGQWRAPKLCGKWLKVAFWSHKARIHKNIKVCFQTKNIVWDDYFILVIAKSRLAKNRNWQWQMANMAMSNLGSFWRTDKSWVSKSIRIVPGIRFWGLKPSQTAFTVWKQNFSVFVNSCLVTLEGNLQPFTAKFGGPPLTPAASIFLIWHVWKEF